MVTLDNIEHLEKLFLNTIEPEYVLYLHNDPFFSAFKVVASLIEHIKLSNERATSIMLQAHRLGIAVILVCPKEDAIEYKNKLENDGLTITIEELS
jgi:ATP-dependent Clp protease adaptor protein ClpS